MLEFFSFLVCDRYPFRQVLECLQSRGGGRPCDCIPEPDLGPRLRESWPAKARNLPSQGSVLCFLTLFSLIKSVCRPTSQTVYKFLWMKVSLCKDENGKMLNCINIYNRAVAGKMYNSPKLLISHTPVRCDKDVNFLNWVVKPFKLIWTFPIVTSSFMDVIKDICKIKLYQDKFTARDRCNQTVCFLWIFLITLAKKWKNIRLINLACQMLRCE